MYDLITNFYLKLKLKKNKTELLGIGTIIALLFLFGVMCLYYVTQPCFTPKSESLSCNEDYECTLNKKYLFKDSTEQIILDPKNSKIYFELKEHTPPIGKGSSLSYWSYSSILVIRDKNYRHIKPFENRAIYKLPKVINEKHPNEFSKSIMRKSIENSNESLKQEFEKYLQNPRNKFVIVK